MIAKDCFDRPSRAGELRRFASETASYGKPAWSASRAGLVGAEKTLDPRGLKKRLLVAGASAGLRLGEEADRHVDRDHPRLLRELEDLSEGLACS
jgi:hypothetical protein